MIDDLEGFRNKEYLSLVEVPLLYFGFNINSGTADPEIVDSIKYTGRKITSEIRTDNQIKKYSKLGHGDLYQVLPDAHIYHKNDRLAEMNTYVKQEDIKDWLQRQNYSSIFFETQKLLSLEEAEVRILQILQQAPEVMSPKAIAGIKASFYVASHKKEYRGLTTRQALLDYLTNNLDILGIKKEAVEKISEIFNADPKGQKIN